jgi:hypothetical protein
MPKNPFKLLVLDARNGGVEKARQLCRRFIDKKGRPTEDDTGIAINRKSSPLHVQRLARKMITGRWKDCSSPFAQTKKGYLKQGRHRCLAFIEAAKVVPDLKLKFWIQTGIPDESAYAYKADEKAESISDRWVADGQKHAKHAAISRFILFKGCSPVNRIITEDVRDFASAHQKDICRIESLLQGKEKVSAAHIVAPITRAFLSTRKAREIARFCAILVGEIPNIKKCPWEKTVYLLREIILVTPSRCTMNLVYLYRVTEAVLQLFLEKAPPPEKIRPAKGELFLLPGDTVFSPGEKPAFLVPLLGTGGRAIEKTISNFLTKGVIPIKGLKFGRLQRNSKLLVFVPNHSGRSSPSTRDNLLATAVFSKVQHNEEEDMPEMIAKEVKKISGHITADKLYDLSIAQRKLLDFKRMASEITKIHPKDIEILKR